MVRTCDRCEVRLRGNRSVRRLASTVVPLLVLAGCSGAGPAGTDDPTTQLALSLDGVESNVPLGEPTTVTLTVTNSGTRSESTSVEISLVLPDGTDVPFHRTTLFVPFGDEASETVSLTTARWSPDVGEFAVRARFVDAASTESTASWAFDVGDATRTVPRFEDVTELAGLVTTVPSPSCGQFANGAAWGDVNGDGWPDLVVTRLGDPVQLFMNQGDGTFADESTVRGVLATGSNGAAIADYDNDGDADVMLVGDGLDVLLRNDGTGVFEDVTDRAGVAGDAASRGMSASWGDFDADGNLDLYVTNYMECTGEWETSADVITEVGYHSDVLYRNQGDGTFSDVSADLPDSERDAAGFAAAWVDVDDDGRLDLYVANDFVGLSPDHNRLWRNMGAGPDGWAFDDTSLASGAGLYMNTMGIGLSDVDRDGDTDMALSNIGGNKLLRNTGDGTFVEETASGIERPTQGVEHSTVTWGTVFADFDLDGWDDLFMAAGNLPQGPDVVVGAQPNMVFLNDGTGERFLDVSALTGADNVGDSKGVALADFDRDGAIDLFVVDQDGSPRLYRNVTPRTDRHWLEVDVVGTVSNRDGCGARIIASVDGGTITRTVLCGSGGTGSGNEHRVHIGLGSAATVDAVEIWWPSGIRQVVDVVEVDQILTVVEPPA